jgi:aminopeptidase N
MLKKRLITMLLVLFLSGCVVPQVAPLPQPIPASTAMVTPLPTRSADAAGLGDLLFPRLGNTGYDVEHYTLDLSVDPLTNVLTSTATIRAKAEMVLDRFHLDFHGLTIEKLTVSGEDTGFTREDGELIVDPVPLIDEGDLFTVTVSYYGQPDPRTLPMLGEIGWLHRAGGILVVSQPAGAATWFPANDHPLDKATYTIRITVPEPYIAASNGLLDEVIETETTRTYIWEVVNPMASYLATVAIYPFETSVQEGPNGLPILNFTTVKLSQFARAALERTPEMIEFLEARIGPYPFESYGAIVVAFPWSLETQSRSLLSRSQLFSLREELVMHELAHQWFGNSVSLGRWQDIWLNEGFATYISWLWAEETRGEQAFERIVRDSYQPLFLSMPPGAPAVDTLFDYSVYARGALTLHALRLRVGDEDFFEILQTYYARYRDSHVTTDDFIAVAEEVSGQSLGDFFQDWLYTTGIPPLLEMGN